MLGNIIRASPMLCIIFNLRSKLLMWRSIYPSTCSLDHAFVAGKISSAPGL
jgi:hypothetical protein